MTTSRPRQDTPRRPPQPPRAGVRRANLTATVVDPVTASGATAWFDAHDGSGLQEVPSRIGVGVATLGSSTGVDTNDPSWGSSPYGWTFDATDDYIGTSGTGMLVTTNGVTGAYTHLQVVTPVSANSRQYWTSGTSAVSYLRLQAGTGSQVLFGARGNLASVATAATVVTLAKSVIGFVITGGTAAVYYYNGITGTLGTAVNMSGIGTMTPTVPRYGNASYGVGAGIGTIMNTMVEFNGIALAKADMDTVAAYLYGLF